MLDDLKMIHQRDTQDALGIAEKQAQQLEHDFKFENSEFTINKYENVVYAGMGGSSLAALLARTWPAINTPLQVVRDYTLPAYVSPATLVIAASYSGNTEETLSAIIEARQKGAQVVVIAGGGKLAEFAIQNDYPMLTLPKAAQPRYAILYNFKALLFILAQGGFIDSNELDTVLNSARTHLNTSIKKWLPAVPAKNNPAKQLALEMIGKSPVIYAGPLMYPAAYKWKISFNENAKNIAWCSEIPEFNHNEFVGWSSHPVDKPYAIVDLRSSFEHPRTQKRFEVSERLLSGMRPAVNAVNAEGDTVLDQLLWAVAYGDFVTLYTAMLNNVDPTPVALVEKFKKELG